MFCRFFYQHNQYNLSALKRILQRNFTITTKYLYGQIIQYKLTDIGEGIRQVTLKEWYVKLGDHVKEFDSMCEVQSDKASVTITSRYEGIITKLHHELEGIALVGYPLVDIKIDQDVEGNVIDDENDDYDSKSDSSSSSSSTSSSTSSTMEDVTIEILATPAVRKLAKEQKIDINTAAVRGSGKHGRILKEDIFAFIKLQKDKTVSVKKDFVKEDGEEHEVVPLTPVQISMWKSMTESLEIPDFSYCDEIDVTQLHGIRQELNVNNPITKLSFMPFLIKAASLCLLQYPMLNARLDINTKEMIYIKSHNISLAMDTPAGLIVPNIKNVQNLSINDIAVELQRLQISGHDGNLTIRDLLGGTFSLSNIGTIGGTYTRPRIYPPQVAIGAITKAKKMPRYIDGSDELKARYIMMVTWCADHRVIDGVTMAKFSKLWQNHLENPYLLMLNTR